MQMRELIVQMRELISSSRPTSRGGDRTRHMYSVITSDVAWRGPHASHVLRHHVRRRVSHGLTRVASVPMLQASTAR
jgi:hypothetical protein